jgi:hypothetical protein
MNERRLIICYIAAGLIIACSSDDKAGFPDGGGDRGATSSAGAGGNSSNAGGATGRAGSGGTVTGSGGATGRAGSGKGGAGGGSGTAGTSSGGRAPDAGTDGAGPPHPDAGIGNDGGDGASPLHDAGKHLSRVFITHQRWDGDLKQAAANDGINVTTGLDAADAFCNRAATDAGLGGLWVAWLSDSVHDALDRIDDVGPWYRVDGAEVFADKAALLGNPLIEIDLDENGADTELIPDGGGLANIPWTGTLADGTASQDTCNDWTNDAADVHGLAGANTATTDAKWSEATAPLCNNPYHLYCFEQ